MTTQQSFRRVLILADESADWMVAGLRQLDRLALAVDEFAVENNETSPVLVCILWRPDLDQSQKWVPKNERLTRVAFTTDIDSEPYDVVLCTRLFLYRNAMRKLLEASTGLLPQASLSGEMERWEANLRKLETLPRFGEGAWEYMTSGDQVDEIEKRFLRACAKSQDGLVSRYFHRPISRVVSRLLLRFPTTPNGLTWSIFPIAVVASLILCHGTYASFLWALVLFEIFSILDGCDGEIARAKFLESERGRRLDHLFDVLGNIMLVIGLGVGLARQASLAGHSGWFYAIEGGAAAVLIGLNEFNLTRRKTGEIQGELGSLEGLLYPRHQELIDRSGILHLGTTFTYWAIQLTKRDSASLLFVLLAVMGLPALILHLLLAVTVVTLALAWRSRSKSQTKS